MGAFFVGVCFVGAATAACTAPPGLPQVQVSRVVDGDTLRLQDGRSVRMIGLNAPELGRKGRTDEPFAVAARQRLQALVTGSGGRLGLQLGRESKDKYGRTLAHVYGRDGSNLQDQLLRDGLALQVAVAPNNDLAGCQQAAEKQARAARRGMWQQPPVMAAGQVSQSGFALVSGEVTRVQRNRGGVWLSLGDGLVLRVAPAMLGAFPVGALEAWQGKRVEARGWVLDRSRRGGLKPGQQRWLLPITDPVMIQLAH